MQVATSLTRGKSHFWDIFVDELCRIANATEGALESYERERRTLMTGDGACEESPYLYFTLYTS
jgi:hypothetical protein